MNTGTLNLILHSRKGPFWEGKETYLFEAVLQHSCKEQTMVHGNTYENVLGILSGNVKAIWSSPVQMENELLVTMPLSAGDFCQWACDKMFLHDQALFGCMLCVAPGSEHSCCKGNYLTDWSTTISNFKTRENEQRAP